MVPAQTFCDELQLRFFLKANMQKPQTIPTKNINCIDNTMVKKLYPQLVKSNNTCHNETSEYNKKINWPLCYGFS